MAIAKLLLVLVSLCSHMYVATPPNACPPTEQLREQRGLEHSVVLVYVLGRIVSFAWATFEILVLLALSNYCPPSIANSLLDTLRVPPLVISNPATFTALSPAFFVGTVVMFAGSCLRAHCFHTLGSQFTFHLSIRPAHTLVTTGVYSVVRHPSYTGAMMMIAGWLSCLLDIQPWLVDACSARLPSLVGDASDEARCQMMVMNAFVGLSTAFLGVGFVWLRTRMDKEDAMLEKNFGEQWRKWAKRVPWRLIPGIY